MIEKQLPRRSRVLILAGLLTPILLVATLAAILYRSQEQLVESAQWVAHARDVQQRLQRLGAEMANAEAAQRGFLLTSNELYLEPYRAALVNVPKHMEELRRLVASNSAQRTNLARLEVHVGNKLEFMRENVAFAESGRYREAVASVLTGRGREAMEHLRLDLARMEREEMALLDVQQNTLAGQFSRHTLVATTLVALSVLFAAVILYLLRRMSQARAWARICAWSRTIEYEGEWLTFEQYLQRRFDYRITHGMSPQVLDEMDKESKRDSVGGKS